MPGHGNVARPSLVSFERIGMHQELKKEIEIFEKRTRKSYAAHQKAMPYMPLGVSSNFRSYEPYPLFIRDAQGGKVHDLDGHEYLDFNLYFGGLMAGHYHPAMVKAFRERLPVGSL